MTVGKFEPPEMQVAFMWTTTVPDAGAVNVIRAFVVSNAVKAIAEATLFVTATAGS